MKMMAEHATLALLNAIGRILVRALYQVGKIGNDEIAPDDHEAPHAAWRDLQGRALVVAEQILAHDDGIRVQAGIFQEERVGLVSRRDLLHEAATHHVLVIDHREMGQLVAQSRPDQDRSLDDVAVVPAPVRR